MTQNNTLPDYFLSAQPFDVFGGLEPGHSGIEISFDGKENRLLTLPNDVSADVIKDALLTEFEFYTKFRAALTQSFLVSPFKRGPRLSQTEIQGADFAVANREHSEIVAVYASANIDGINSVFIKRILRESEHVKTLILATPQWPKNVALPENTLSSKVEIFPGRDVSRLAEITVDYFYDKISNNEGLSAPAKATFKLKKRPGEGQST